MLFGEHSLQKFSSQFWKLLSSITSGFLLIFGHGVCHDLKLLIQIRLCHKAIHPHHHDVCHGLFNIRMRHDSRQKRSVDFHETIE